MFMDTAFGYEVKRRCIEYFEKNPPYLLKHSSGALWRFIVGGVFLFSVAGIPLGIGLWVSALIKHSKELHRLKKMLQSLNECVPAHVYIYRLYSGLLSPGTRAGVAVVVFSLDPAADEKDPSWFIDIVERITASEDCCTDPIDQKIKTTIVDRTYAPNDRVSLPMEITGGILAEVGGLMIEPRYLPEKMIHVDVPMLMALVSPRPEGPLFLIPPHLIAAKSGRL